MVNADDGEFSFKSAVATIEASRGDYQASFEVFLEVGSVFSELLHPDHRETIDCELRDRLLRPDELREFLASARPLYLEFLELKRHMRPKPQMSFQDLTTMEYLFTNTYRFLSRKVGAESLAGMTAEALYLLLINEFPHYGKTAGNVIEERRAAEAAKRELEMSALRDRGIDPVYHQLDVILDGEPAGWTQYYALHEFFPQILAHLEEKVGTSVVGSAEWDYLFSEMKFTPFVDVVNSFRNEIRTEAKKFEKDERLAVLHHVNEIHKRALEIEAKREKKAQGIS